jgi:hypothetical protein
MIDKKYLIIGSSAILLVLFFYAFTSAKTVAYTVAVKTTVVENITLLENRTIEESYVSEEDVPQQSCTQEFLPYNITGWNGSYVCDEYSSLCLKNAMVCNTTGKDGVCTYYIENCTEYSCLKRHAECYLYVLNRGNAKADWTIGLYMIYNNQRIDKENLTQTVDPHSEKLFIWGQGLDNPNDQVFCEYYVYSVGIRKTCEYKMVKQPKVRQRNTTITEESRVPEERVESVNQSRIKRINRLFGYEQGFYLGY